MTLRATRKKARYATARKISAWRSSLTFLALFAFAVQSFVTQTHIHRMWAESAVSTTAAQSLPSITAEKSAAAAIAVASRATRPEPKDPYAPNEDPANCPLCQEILHAGHYIAPVAVALPLPMAAPIGTVVFVQALLHRASTSHGWRSRAPPLV